MHRIDDDGGDKTESGRVFHLAEVDDGYAGYDDFPV